MLVATAPHRCAHPASSTDVSSSHKTEHGALPSPGVFPSRELLVATSDPADRTIVTLYRDSAAPAISPIIAVGTISGSIIVAIVTRLRSNSHAADRCINGNLS